MLNLFFQDLPSYRLFLKTRLANDNRTSIIFFSIQIKIQAIQFVFMIYCEKMKTYRNHENDELLDVNRIIKTYKPLVTYVVRNIVKNKMDAEEIVHDAFIKALAKLNHFKPEKGCFKTWLSTLAKNTALDFVKKKDYRIWNNSIDNVPEGFNEPAEDDNRLIICIHFLSSAFNELNDKQSNVLRLRYVEGKTYEEISIIIGINIEQTRLINHRALEQLRNIAKSKKVNI